MNIKRAKEEIEHTVKAYLAKDALGEYAIPAIRQRPILLMGPPGIGKTQVMEQVARECGVALVAYTITHHTRQSAVGLPFIRQRHYGDKDVSVTEYTMSEIIASIYAKMEATGLSEGILFIDEINCVSETLAPTMLQFLQCKTFGNQAVPAGWVIVAAGNPPEYNKSVRDFDIVTLDRVRRMDIEPDLPVWKDYARAAHIHSAILSYLELHPQNFYQINADVDGTQFVTARGWEDLSNLLDTYEALGLQADEELIREYIQHPKIAEDFSAYLDLYYKYRDDYGVEEILAGQAKPAVFARLLQAPFDERLSLVSLLLAGLDTRFAASLQADAVADACYAFLRETKKALATLPEDIPDGSAELFSQQIKDYETETQQKRDAGLLGKAELTNRLQVQAALHQWEGELRRANAVGTQEAFDLLRGQFRVLADQRETTQKTAAAALEAAFDFMEQAFAESQEMVVFVTELTVNPASHQFLTENGCERYFKYNKDLLLDHRKAALQQELAAVAVGTHVNAQYTVAFFNLANYSSTGAITEENAGVTIGPVHNTAQSFRTDNQNLVIQTALNHLACYSKAVNKTAAACSQVKRSCVFSTQTSLYQAGSGRENIVGGSSAYNNEIQLFRSNAGVLQCFYSSIVRQIGGCFFRSSDVTLLDAGALSNPFVTGLNNFLHVCISDNLLRNIMS